jgi:hypothetical protein
MISTTHINNMNNKFTNMNIKLINLNTELINLNNKKREGKRGGEIECEGVRESEMKREILRERGERSKEEVRERYRNSEKQNRDK